MMFDADAIGNMRNELVQNLGRDVARGIMERVGYQSGRNDARQLQERFTWPSDEEWLRAGSRLHYLEGLMKVGVSRMEIRRAEGKFYITGDWLDSHEAEQHVKHLGVGDRPVCWSLEGYATGYATEFFGEEIFCVETRCRAKGDPRCSFELRPAREWGNSEVSIKQMLAGSRFTDGFDRCLRAINEKGCELEQASLDAIITTDRNGIVTSASQGACNLLGLNPGKATGRPLSEIFAGGEDETRRIMQRLETENRIWNHLTELIASDGHRVPASLSASSIRDSQGDVIGTLAIARNLTEQRRLEDELEARDRFMANILQDSADAIVTLDLNDAITSWNRGAEQVFGYSASEVVGKSLDLLVPPELTESRELEHIHRKLRTAGSVRSYQTERLTKDGRRIQVVFTRTAIRDDSGKFIGSSAVVKDITRVLNLERELADAGHFATLGELSAGLAHEIKNPLAGIKGAIDVIRDSLAREDPQREILGDVLYEVHRIDKIVRDLLSYARPKPPTHSDVCLPEIVQRIAGMVRQSSNKESVSLRVSHVTPIPSFTGDATQIEETVLNLLLNAGHAVQARGTIEVLMSYDAERAIVRLEVCDDGRGIAQEIRRKIFQPFFTTRVDGTGLGLATCLKNVQYHGGSIEVESELGRGAKFVVSLPLLCRL